MQKVSSHIPYPGAGYAAGIKKSRHISKQAFKDFVRTGVVGIHEVSLMQVTGR